MDSAEALLNNSYVRKQCVLLLNRKSAEARTTEDVDLLEELVRSDKFFQGLSPPVRHELCRVMQHRTFDEGDFIFKQGEVGATFFVILVGRVGVYVDNDAGEGIPRAELGEGQSFGEMALVDDHTRRNATLRARESCEFLVVSKHDYRSTLVKLQTRATNEKGALFSGLPCFARKASLDKYALTGLIKTCEVVAHKPNTVVCRQGDPAVHIFIVKSGKCRLIKQLSAPCQRAPRTALGESETADRIKATGDRVCFVDAETLAPGAFFGESGLGDAHPAEHPASEPGPGVRSGGPAARRGSGSALAYPAHLVTVCACEVLSVRISDFLRFSQECHDLAALASHRTAALHPQEVARKVFGQIEWELEKTRAMSQVKLRFPPKPPRLADRPKPKSNSPNSSNLNPKSRPHLKSRPLLKSRSLKSSANRRACRDAPHQAPEATP